MPLFIQENEVIVVQTRVDPTAHEGISFQTFNSGNIIDVGGGATQFFWAGGKLDGYIAYIQTLGILSPTIEEEATEVLPPEADPPFPPVWPYVWDSSLIYGRQHLGQNLRMTRKDTFKFRATITKNGDSVDITGATFTLTVKWNVVDAGSIFTCTLGDGITVVDAPTGIIDITISSAKTSALPPYDLILPYDLQMIESSGDVSTVLLGNLTIRPDIT